MQTAPTTRRDVRDELRSQPAEVRASALFDWRLWARPNQLAPPGDAYRYFLLLAGRGYGKTRAGNEWIRSQIESGASRRAIIVAPTAADLRDTMVEGPSGLLSICPPWNYPHYEPSKRRLTWPSGAIATLFSAEEPDRLRGANSDLLLADELAAWPRPQAWDMALLSLRIGANPRAMVTTTPRPTKLIRDLIDNPLTVTHRGSTFENEANLAPQFIGAILSRYENTRLGKQEIYGEMLESVEGAWLTREQIEAARVEAVTEQRRTVVGVDPAITSGDNADKTGIVVACLDAQNNLYALADRSCRLGPAGWARRVVDVYTEFGADLIVAERNQGGLMVEHTIRSVDREVPIKLVNATKGKHVRAQPILSLIEQGRAHTLPGCDALEEQLSRFTNRGYEGDDSPDSADAFVWAGTELTQNRGAQIFIGGVAA